VNHSNGVKILQITSYPPPRAGWGVRVEFLKKRLEAEDHVCTVLNIGRSRTIPSPEYETVMGGLDYLVKVWRFSRRGFVVHMHVNGEAEVGFILALVAEVINLAWGKRCFLTFHAGIDHALDLPDALLQVTLGRRKGIARPEGKRGQQLVAGQFMKPVKVNFADLGGLRGSQRCR